MTGIDHRPTTASAWDELDQLTIGHRPLTDPSSRLDGSRGPERHQGRGHLAGQLIERLSGHAAIDEGAVYAIVADVISDRDGGPSRCLGEHKALKKPWTVRLGQAAAGPGSYPSATRTGSALTRRVDVLGESRGGNRTKWQSARLR